MYLLNLCFDENFILEDRMVTIIAFNITTTLQIDITCMIGNIKLYLTLYKCNATYTTVCKYLYVSMKIWIRWVNSYEIIIYRIHDDMFHDINRLNNLLNEEYDFEIKSKKSEEFIEIML